jgi:hypothetical protein
VISIKQLCALGVSFSVLMVVGCSDDSSDNGGNADAKAYITSCEKLCVAQDTAKCDTGGLTITVADCKTLCQLAAGFTGDCAAKYKLYGQCTDNLTDPCTADSACATQMDTASTACGF